MAQERLLRIFRARRQIWFWRSTHSVSWLNEWVVDSDNVNVIVLNGVTEDNATDTTEAVDSNLSLSHDAVIRSVQDDELVLSGKKVCDVQTVPQALQNPPNLCERSSLTLYLVEGGQPRQSLQSYGSVINIATECIALCAFDCKSLHRGEDQDLEDLHYRV